MKPALTLRASLEGLMPAALHRLPPGDAPRGIEEAVPIFRPVRDRNEERLSTVQADYGSDEELGDVRELEEMFEFGPEAANSIPALGGTEGERIRQAVLAKGVDALGWYAPFHLIGVQWGIYIPTSSLAYLAKTAFSSVPVDVTTRVKIAFRAIHQHELFHFATEYAVAQLELLVGEPIHVHRSELKDPQLGYIVAEERAANAWMLRSLPSTKRTLRSPGRAKALRRFVSRQPAGYRDAGEIVGTDNFRAACHDLIDDYLSLRYDTRGAERINLDWLLPLTPRIDWRQVPVHVIHDDKRLPFAPGAFDLFEHVREIVSTESFEAGLEKLPRPLQRAWQKTQRMLSVSTALTGLDFKLWDRVPSGRVYSVRVSRGYRAHLRYDDQGTWFAEEIGPHAAMGHG
jgi:hypothetical protein